MDEKDKAMNEIVDLVEGVLTVHVQRIFGEAGKVLNTEQAHNVIANVGMKIYLRNLKSKPLIPNL